MAAATPRKTNTKSPTPAVPETPDLGDLGDLSPAAREVLAERARQIAKGYTPENDVVYRSDQLSRAASCYAAKGAGVPFHQASFLWPFPSAAWKPGTSREARVKAAALLLASLEAEDHMRAARDPVEFTGA